MNEIRENGVQNREGKGNRKKEKREERGEGVKGEIKYEQRRERESMATRKERMRKETGTERVTVLAEGEYPTLSSSEYPLPYSPTSFICYSSFTSLYLPSSILSTVLCFNGQISFLEIFLLGIRETKKTFQDIRSGFLSKFRRGTKKLVVLLGTFKCSHSFVCSSFVY